MMLIRSTASLAIALSLTLVYPCLGRSQGLPSRLPDNPGTPNPNAKPDFTPILFNAPTPPSTGRPGRRSDAGSRGCGLEGTALESKSQPLMALVPVHPTIGSGVTFGKTAAAHPTFWFYVPQPDGLTAMFVLQDQEGFSLYQSEIPLPKQPGMVSVTLPTTTAPLMPGQAYHWFFKLYCRPTSPPHAFVDGWVQRESLPVTLMEQLKIATLEQQVRLYAANGFWFDAFNTSIEIRRQRNGDGTWVKLLKAIGLEF